MTTRHIAPGLFAGWQVTNPDGQHTAHITGTRQDAVECAHRQVNALGGGHVLLDEDDEP
ncbi:hypothetical protein FHX42_002283 [Saccharopolyspora lacisalsi]|uniref:DUF2188 domain-containing protein n=1 Tax=Halosaccharopolyspora lacisalsi TaxID=1000566 RepID=A0A839DXI6_9PSEU|nr:hypothetical protein [Halosaccharopolyspora lacisalsi]MBA8824936.1 hypothetical protein [Halosaccharopolyspora lacisalsi]